ncbi:MAG: RHS repeat-associated core domain-containing protein, partial [Verrucomicrobiota bacterium]
RADYGYNPDTGLLETVTNADYTFTYGYQYDQASAAAPRTGSVTGAKQDIMPYTLTRSDSTTPQTVRTYEATRDVLASIQNNAGPTARSSYDYVPVNGGVNKLGQRRGVRTTFNLGDGVLTADTSWGYDDLGQLTSANAPGTAADRAYRYDTIGNRLFSEVSNTVISSPATANTTAYTANGRNQYAGAGAITGALIAAPVFDDDGNMTTGPLSGTGGSTANHLRWDAENRLIEVRGDNDTTVVATYAYDALSRRIAKIPASGSPTLYLYDGFNCIAQYAGTTLSKTRTWGLDLSGSLQGAGGVGGLLVEKQGTTSYYPTYDGNGNVSEYLTSTGAVASHFEYDPFGNTVVDTDDAIAPLFAYRFSTKPLDFETGLYYYGYRYYDPVTGRWTSRDPIGEEGGANLYAFVGNDGVNKWDYLGQKPQLSAQTTNKKPGYCGAAVWDIHWTVSNATWTVGLIYQQVTTNGYEEPCGQDRGSRRSLNTPDMTEYWEVNSPKVNGIIGTSTVSDNATDEFLSLHGGCNTKGELTLKARAQYAEGVAPNAPARRNSVGQAGGLWAETGLVYPRNARTYSNFIERTWKLKWNCCDGASHLTEVN